MDVEDSPDFVTTTALMKLADNRRVLIPKPAIPLALPPTWNSPAPEPSESSDSVIYMCHVPPPDKFLESEDDEAEVLEGLDDVLLNEYSKSFVFMSHLRTAPDAAGDYFLADEESAKLNAAERKQSDQNVDEDYEMSTANDSKNRTLMLESKDRALLVITDEQNLVMDDEDEDFYDASSLIIDKNLRNNSDDDDEDNRPTIKVVIDEDLDENGQMIQ